MWLVIDWRRCSLDSALLTPSRAALHRQRAMAA